MKTSLWGLVQSILRKPTKREIRHEELELQKTEEAEEKNSKEKVPKTHINCLIILIMIYAIAFSYMTINSIITCKHKKQKEIQKQEDLNRYNDLLNRPASMMKQIKLAIGGKITPTVTVTKPHKTLVIVKEVAVSLPRATSSPKANLTDVKAIAYQKVVETWGAGEWEAFETIIQYESGWRYWAVNNSSGATGLCQSLPANKMASEGADYLTNPETQINWCIKYIKNRYQQPSLALAFWQQHRWF